MYPKVDLHSHTLASDGALTPAELVARAAEMGVEMLAITDHDTCAGLAEGRRVAETLGIELINGIELSTTWNGAGVHIVGLGVDPASAAMVEAQTHQHEARRLRAIEIGRRLDKLGMPGALEGARDLAGDAEIGRPHFARFLLAQGHVRTMDEAFRSYLGAGKPGDVKCHWPSMPQVVDWITASGGIAVVAHPGKYKMTWSKLRRLLKDFIAAGGQGLEVSYSGENPDRVRELIRLANDNGLLASVGSDFHSPAFHWAELGKYPPLRGEIQPVWERF